MLNELLTDLTEKYHDLGHVDPAVDAMMDMGGGFGHRVDFGHDLDGFFAAYNMEGCHGLRSWADHMLKDFTSPHGLPLPFSSALVHLTPVDIDTAVTWLSVNAADFMELGAEVAAMEILQVRFAENTKAYQVALAVGLMLGFVDDNPLLIAYSGAKWLVNAKRNLELVSPMLGGRVNALLTRTVTGFERASYYALGADAALHILHVADVVSWFEHTLEGLPLVGGAADLGEGVGDVIDGLATFGLVLGARRMVRSLFQMAKGAKQREAARLANAVRPKAVLVRLLEDGAPPAALVGTLNEMKALQPEVC